MAQNYPDYGEPAFTLPDFTNLSNQEIRDKLMERPQAAIEFLTSPMKNFCCLN